MYDKLLVSFKDNIVRKASNPFLGTYSIVWLVRNWDVVFAFFNLPSEYPLDKKIETIRTFYYHKNFIKDLFVNILIALCVVIITYLLLNLSRLIVNIYDKKLTPWIYKLTDKSSVVLKIDYDKVKSSLYDLQKKYDIEKDEKYKYQILKEASEKEIIDLKTKIAALSRNGTNENKDDNFSEAKENEKINSSENLEERKLQKEKVLITQKGYNTSYIRIARDIKKGYPVNIDNNFLDYLIDRELVIYNGENDGLYNIDLSTKGKKLLNLLLDI